MSFGVLFPLLVGTMVDVAAGVVPAWLGGRGLKSVALLLVATLLVQSVLSFFSSYVYHRVGEVGVGRLRKDVFEHLMALPMRFFNEHRVGELASRLSSDLMQIQDLLTFSGRHGCDIHHVLEALTCHGVFVSCVSRSSGDVWTQRPANVEGRQ